MADGPSTAKCTGVASDSATLSYAGTLFYLLACATHAVAAARERGVSAASRAALAAADVTAVAAAEAPACGCSGAPTAMW